MLGARATKHFQSHAVSSSSNFFSDIFTFQVPCFYLVCGGVARRAVVFLVIKVQWCLVGVYEGNCIGAIKMSNSSPSADLFCPR